MKNIKKTQLKAQAIVVGIYLLYYTYKMYLSSVAGIFQIGIQKCKKRGKKHEKMVFQEYELLQ